MLSLALQAELPSHGTWFDIVTALNFCFGFFPLSITLKYTLTHFKTETNGLH